jgi:NADH:ubiquinone oxidoreductase subunit 5 (subunit L)/multisubunit Na+/H+ antiporter MnhA subunit
MDKTDCMPIVAVVLLLIAAGFTMNPTPNTSSVETAAINSTGVYSITLSIEPLASVVASVVTIIASLLSAYSYFKKKSEEHRWKDVVVK